MFSPISGGSVDFVDMSAELYELPSKVGRPSRSSVLKPVTFQTKLIPIHRLQNHHL
jgi:hypothetical protein